MNLLAHLHLIHSVPPAVAAGNFFADFLRYFNGVTVDDCFQAGIRLHLKIDEYADTHPFHKRARMCISHSRRRLAGIMIDVAFDYFLTNHWNQFSNISLQEFVTTKLEKIREYLEAKNSSLQPLLTTIVEGGWNCPTARLTALVPHLPGSPADQLLL